MRPGSFALVSAIAFAFAAGPGAAQPMMAIPGDPVSTASGKVAGTRLASGIKAYLGVPFAKPPVGDLRWRPPQPTSWPGVWNADRKGAECIQVLRPHDINHYFGEEASGENCLYMNIWTPAEAKAGEKRPVVVFIYGGGGTIGSSGMANYDGENFAKRGAIFVNFNYRLGLLGFMAHPELSKEQGGASGNYGYMDQSAALRWVHDNIAAFGGDPDKVLISGQSAGAGGVAAQITSPMSKGLFRAAVMMSSCNFAGAAAPLAEGEAVGVDLQKRLGAADLAALRNVPADRILATQSESQVGVSVQGLRAPSIIDGAFWTEGKDAAFAAGRFADVPIIASSNGDDIDSNSNPLTKARTVAEYQAAARQMYGPSADAFLALYPVKSDAEVSAMAHAAAMEGGMLRNSRTCGEVKARSGRTATYVSAFMRRHPYTPGVTFPDQDTATVGAYHTADVPYWFDTLDKYNMWRSTRTWTAWDRQLSDQMVKALIAMAETGSPSTAAMPWPAFTAKDPQYLVLGDTAAPHKLEIKRMDWSAAHPISPAALPPARRGPRD